MVIMCLGACLNHVYSHDIGVKKNYNVENSVSGMVVTSDVAVCNYEFADVPSNASFIFIKNYKSVGAGPITSDIDLVNYRTCNYNHSYTFEKSLTNTLAIYPGSLFLPDRINSYVIVKASSLPKHYLLPNKNDFKFGSEQRNC